MTLDKLSLLAQGATSTTNKSDLPNSSELVEALLNLEKLAKKEKTSHTLSNLVGCWNLRFITGTKKSREKAGIALGAGRYIPRIVKIQITYEQDPNSLDRGKVVNSVQFAFLNLSLSGPVKFIPSKNILAFDFPRMAIEIFGRKIYDGYIRNGAKKEQEFYQTKINQQAFFSYFLIQENFIAARGRGGGLALWGREQ